MARKSSRRRAIPEWANQVEMLRRRLGLSQSRLGQELQYSAMAISRWERGLQEPPADCYIKLGDLAGNPDCWYFWERAGLKSSDVIRALPLDKRLFPNRPSLISILWWREAAVNFEARRRRNWSLSRY